MAVRAYIPSEVKFGDRILDGARLVTLYDPDSPHRNGSMTVSTPLDVGTSGGPLTFLARRDCKEWRITLPRIRVRNKTAVGFEYDILDPIEEELLREDVPDSRSKAHKTLGDYGATF